MGNLRFGIIGMGFIAERHMKAIKDVGGELVVACDIEQHSYPVMYVKDM